MSFSQEHLLYDNINFLSRNYFYIEDSILRAYLRESLVGI